MKFRTATLALAALAMSASPAIAEAAFERAGAPVEDESELSGGAGVLGLLAVAAVIAGVVAVSSSSDEELPISS